MLRKFLQWALQDVVRDMVQQELLDVVHRVREDQPTKYDMRDPPGYDHEPRPLPIVNRDDFDAPPFFRDAEGNLKVRYEPGIAGKDARERDAVLLQRLKASRFSPEGLIAFSMGVEYLIHHPDQDIRCRWSHEGFKGPGLVVECRRRIKRGWSRSYGKLLTEESLRVLPIDAVDKMLFDFKTEMAKVDQYAEPTEPPPVPDAVEVAPKE